MANRNRYQQENQFNEYYDDDRGYGRQQEQFDRQSYGQYDDTSQRDERMDSSRRRERDYSRQSNYNQPRQGASRRDYNPLDQYEQDENAGRRQSGEHALFRGDTYGGESMSGPIQSVGGGSFFPQSNSGGYGQAAYDRNGYRDDGSRQSYRGERDDRGFFDRAGDEIASWFGDEDAERRRRMDHRGRGPANYTRSNERLLEDSCERLTHDRGVDASNISVTCADNEVTLDGQVNTRWEKRRAEDLVHDISGVQHVQNNLRIQQTDMRAGQSEEQSIRTQAES